MSFAGNALKQSVASLGNVDWKSQLKKVKKKVNKKERAVIKFHSDARNGLNRETLQKLEDLLLLSFEKGAGDGIKPSLAADARKEVKSHELSQVSC